MLICIMDFLLLNYPFVLMLYSKLQYTCSIMRLFSCKIPRTWAGLMHSIIWKVQGIFDVRLGNIVCFSTILPGNYAVSKIIVYFFLFFLIFFPIFMCTYLWVLVCKYDGIVILNKICWNYIYLQSNYTFRHGPHYKELPIVLSVFRLYDLLSR